jgi:hypothetical protein
MPDCLEERGRRASIEGFANEHIVCGLLMKRYENVSLVDLPLSSYDIIIARKTEAGTEDIIRVQVKTARKSVSFIGGSRGGVDRTYKSGVKTYIQSPERSDCVVAVSFVNNVPELYFIPTLLINDLRRKSISLRKIQALKDNYEMLEKCKDAGFVRNKAREYGILPPFNPSSK